MARHKSIELLSAKTVSKKHLYFGDSGEESAVGLLQAQGYKILARNYRAGSAEIDIIARDKDTFCFIEVKARNSDRFGLPEEAVSVFKQRRISRVALVFLKENKLLDKKARFDVISLLYSESGIKADLIKNAFDLNPAYTY